MVASPYVEVTVFNGVRQTEPSCTSSEVVSRRISKSIEFVKCFRQPAYGDEGRCKEFTHVAYFISLSYNSARNSSCIAKVLDSFQRMLPSYYRTFD